MGLNQKPLFFAHQNLKYARLELHSAGINLWRARKMNYAPVHLRHFERLVGAALDHVWDMQQLVKELSR